MMFKESKHFCAKQWLGIAAIFALVSCSPVANNEQVLMSHSDMVKNFENNAFACYSPIDAGEFIHCRTVSRFAHYTMTFMDIEKSGNGFVKVQYKVRFGDENGLSCLNHSSIDPDKITVYNSADNLVAISDDDVESRDEKLIETLKNQIVTHEQKLGKTCYKYTLITTTEPKMMYQIRAEEYVNGAANGKTETIAMFSNGSKAIIEK